MTITVNISYRTSIKIFAQNKARRKFCKCKLLANAFDEKCPSSLVLRFAYKTSLCHFPSTRWLQFCFSTLVLALFCSSGIE